MQAGELTALSKNRFSADEIVSELLEEGQYLEGQPAVGAAGEASEKELSVRTRGANSRLQKPEPVVKCRGAVFPSRLPSAAGSATLRPSGRPRRGIALAKIPFRISPMLATLVAEPFDRENWIYEEKYDGVRMLAYKEGARVSLISRNGIDRSDRYPAIVQAIQELQPDTLLLDGEVIVFDPKGVSRFQFLQQSKGAPEYAIFDCLYRDGKDLRKQALALRRKAVEAVIRRGESLRVSKKLSQNGLKAFRVAGQKGMEGVVCKNLASVYVSRRSPEWLKVKVHQEQEFVIAGFTKPKGSRSDFGALLLGVFGKNGLQFAGKVGTGFDVEALRTLHRRFRPLIQSKSPFAEPVKERDATFLKPELVAQISFTEWTGDDKLRHPVYLGLRDDKKASEVHREG
jgi:bifunctional non-homologous end joining protein LigD